MAPRPRSAHSWVRAEGDPPGPGRAGRAHTAPRGCPDSSRAIGQQWGCRSPRAPALLTPRRDAAAVAAELMRADLRSDGRSAAGCAEVPCCSSTGRRRMQALPSRQRILTALLSSSPLAAIPQSLSCTKKHVSAAWPCSLFPTSCPGHSASARIPREHPRAPGKVSTEGCNEETFGAAASIWGGFPLQSTFGDVEPRGELESKAMPTQHPTNGAWGGRGGGGGGGSREASARCGFGSVCVCLFQRLIN